MATLAGGVALVVWAEAMQVDTDDLGWPAIEDSSGHTEGLLWCLAVHYARSGRVVLQGSPRAGLRSAMGSSRNRSGSSACPVKPGRTRWANAWRIILVMLCAAMHRSGTKGCPVRCATRHPLGRRYDQYYHREGGATGKAGYLEEQVIRASPTSRMEGHRAMRVLELTRCSPMTSSPG